MDAYFREYPDGGDDHNGLECEAAHESRYGTIVAMVLQRFLAGNIKEHMVIDGADPLVDYKLSRHVLHNICLNAQRVVSEQAAAAGLPEPDMEEVIAIAAMMYGRCLEEFNVIELSRKGELSIPDRAPELQEVKDER